MMARSPSTLHALALRNLPRPFHGLSPLLGGPAAALALAEEANESWVSATLPSSAEDAWLDLIANGQGLRRAWLEDDETLRRRIGTIEQRVTPAALKAAGDAALIVLLDSCTVIEHWRAQIYCDDDATEYVTDAYCDEDHLLGVWHGVTVLVTDSLLDGGPEEALVAALARARAAGVSVWIWVQSGVDPIHADPWAEP
jgi:hypothetical protein